MVPLLLIRMNVMIAIRISGIGSPPRLSAKTSLGFGQGTVVDIRTCMYDVRKHVKMNVSLSRKIHIIALPQGTGKACLSAAKSVTTPGNPFGDDSGRLDGTRHDLDRHGRLHARCSCDHQQPEQDDPDGQQVVPVDGAQLDAQPRGLERRAAA